MHRMLCLAVVLVACTAGYAQTNVYLVNPSFADPPIIGDNCPKHQGDPITGWTRTTGGGYRNGDYGYPPCPADNAYASIQGASNDYYQVVEGLTASTAYTFSGQWAYVVTNGSAIFKAEIRSGSDPNGGSVLNLKQITRTTGQAHFDDWNEGWALNFTTPTGVTTVTVKISMISQFGSGHAMHIDDCKLYLKSCPTMPEVTAVSPTVGVRGTTANLSVSGSGFIVGGTTVKLTKGGQADIVATNVVVAGDGTSLTCDANLTGAANGPWSVVVSTTGCPADTLSEALLVILPTFSNGSFELPTAAGGCPVTPIAGFPTDWLVQEIWGYGWGNALSRDSDRLPPTCPPPDGVHYGSSITDTNTPGAEAQLYQTFSVTPGNTYTFYGQFAGGGPNTTKIELRDGDWTGTTIGTTTIHTPTDPSYDWTPAAVSGQPTLDHMTVVWNIQPQSGSAGGNAAHADALAVDVCVSPITVTGMSPIQGVNDTTINATITGSGFAGTPVVQLVKSGQVVTATNVTVVNASQIDCDFDLNGLSSGKYKVYVRQGGCVAEFADAILVIGAAFVNGSFELPTVAQAPCSGIIIGMPTGWNTTAPSGLNRDGQAPPPNVCPSLTDGGHHGSMSEGGAGDFRAYQTVAVNPGWTYEFSGEFTAPGGVTTTLRLLNGDENGTELAMVELTDTSAGWTSGSVQTIAPISGVVTVVWEYHSTGVLPAIGAHADGLKFEPTVICHDPVFDFDGDGDVDQIDFAFFQTCYTGGVGTNPPIYPAGCECADSNIDGAINQADTTAFELCASGPGVAANPACD